MNVFMNSLTCASINSSLLSAKRCLAIMLLRSRMHCLSPSDKPSIGRGVGWKGTPPRLLSRNECKKLDRTLCGVPAEKTTSTPHLFFCAQFSMHSNKKIKSTVQPPLIKAPLLKPTTGNTIHNNQSMTSQKNNIIF